MENRHDIISRINEKYAAMSKGHKAIATYINGALRSGGFMTAAKLGASLEPANRAGRSGLQPDWDMKAIRRCSRRSRHGSRES